MKTSFHLSHTSFLLATQALLTCLLTTPIAVALTPIHLPVNLPDATLSPIRDQLAHYIRLDTHLDRELRSLYRYRHPLSPPGLGTLIDYETLHPSPILDTSQRISACVCTHRLWSFKERPCPSKARTARPVRFSRVQYQNASCT